MIERTMKEVFVIKKSLVQIVGSDMFQDKKDFSCLYIRTRGWDFTDDVQEALQFDSYTEADKFLKESHTGGFFQIEKYFVGV